MTEGWVKGWEGIANYINTSIRTAKNYHYKYSMPVYHIPNGSVYAIAYELDQWLIEFSKEREKENDLGWVYFVQAEDREIKIGWTQKSTMARIKLMQTGCPLKLTLLFQIKGTQYYEAKLHKKFKAHKKLGEWFNPDPSILRFIKKEKEKAK